MEEALRRDGRRVPVCFVLREQTGLTTKGPGSTPGHTYLPREWLALRVLWWP